MAIPQRDERGLALSVWLAGAIVGMIVVIGIGIDLFGCICKAVIVHI